MIRQAAFVPLAMMLCLSVSLVHGEPKEKERGSERTPSKESQGQAGKSQESSGTKQSGNTAPGGDWSARTHSGKQSGTQSGMQNTVPGTTGNATAAAMNKTTQPTGAQGAAAASAVNKNQTPQVSGAQGAAAGAAAANRNQPQYTGAQGAAAGAAAANRNQPQYSGAQGAAVGAAVANNNQAQYSAAQGAAVGAALANNNQSQYSAIPGAAAGAAMTNNNQPQYVDSAGTGGGVPMAGSSQPQNSDSLSVSAAPSATPGNTPVASGAVSAAAGYEAVRNSFNASNVYRPQWWRDHPETWVPTGWAVGAAWQPTSWATIAGLCGYGNASPTSYNYGVNVTAQNGNVMVNGQNIGTTGEYSLQALNIAQAGAAADVSTADQWLPLGVFAMVRDEHQHPQLIVQLAINNQGVLRGNYIDELTESTLPIRGAVDKATKRAAWLVGSNQQTVMESGLSDLTDPETPALIHKNGKTDHWILVRLDRPQ